MKTRMKKNKYAEEYESFLGVEHVRPPRHLEENILGKIKSVHRADQQLILGKLFLSQISIGLFALLFCPQFSFSLTHDIHLFHYFHMNYGANFCSFICGIFFVGLGSLFGMYLLDPHEIIQIRKSKYFISAVVTGLLAGSFIFLGIEAYVETTLLWALGVYMGLIGGIQLNFSFRQSYFLQEN